MSDHGTARRSDLASVLAVIDHAGVPMALLDARCLVIEVNSAFALACGRPIAELMGTDLTDSLISDDRSALSAIIGEVADGAAGEGGEAVEVRFVGADGSVSAIRLHLGALNPTQPGQAPSVLCIAHDRTDERRRERSDRVARVREATANTTDASSGLPNRRGLDMALASAARRSDTNGSPYALLRCEVGWEGTVDTPDDARTQAVSACVDRVRQRLRPADTVALVAPEVVMVVAEDLQDEQDAAGVAYRVLSTVVEPVPTDHGPVSLRIVIGVAMADGATPPHALAAATAEAASDAREPGGFRLMDLRGLGT